MAKMIVVESCVSCPNMEIYKDTAHSMRFYRCALAGRRFIDHYLQPPKWCPLRDATDVEKLQTEVSKLEAALTIDARTEYHAQCMIKEESIEVAKAVTRYLDARDEAIATACKEMELTNALHRNFTRWYETMGAYNVRLREERDEAVEALVALRNLIRDERFVAYNQHPEELHTISATMENVESVITKAGGKQDA